MLLSVALMVKNEEAHLERCLKSIIPLLPQIIVLDTGSTDNTIEIAKKYTKLVYHQNWQDNFALHRNKSFSYCSGKWIMQIDADEELIFTNTATPEMFLSFLEKIPQKFNAVGLVLKDWRESEKAYSAELNVARVFRRNHVKWQRRIHNEPVYENEGVFCPVISLKHYGYDLNSKQKQAKAKRTISLLKKSLEDNPADYESHFYLAQAYASWKNDPKKALKEIIEYISYKPLMGKKFNSSAYHLAAALYLNDKNYDKSLEIVQQALVDNPDNIDICWDLMQIGLKQGNKSLIGAGAKRCVMAIEKHNKNPMKNAALFVFNNSHQSYAIALYHLVTELLENASIEYKKLKHILPKCSNPVQNEIEDKLEKFIEILGWKDKDEKTSIISLDQVQQQTKVLGKKSGIISMPN